MQAVRPRWTEPERQRETVFLSIYPAVRPSEDDMSCPPAGASSFFLARWCIQRPLVHPAPAGASSFFLSNSPEFFLEKNLVNRKPLVPREKNPVKNTGFCPRQTAPKRHSTLFLQTILCRITHVPNPRSGPAPILAWPCRPAPTQPDPAPAVEFFSRSQLLRQN